MSILEWLGLVPGPGSSDRDGAIRRIEAELGTLAPERARYLALFAFLLARVADVDLHVSEAETRQMERLVEEQAGLPAAQAALVVAIAQAENRLSGATHNFLAAREFRDLATEDQKRELLRCLFAVAAADDSISVAEEEAIREVSRELLLDNEEYLAIRAQWRDKRAVLKKG